MTHSKTEYIHQEIAYIHQERARLAERAQNEKNANIRQYMMFQRDFLLARVNELLREVYGA